MLTPYAVLSIKPGSNDDHIRARYHSRIRLHHPDMRADRKPGPEWESLTTAYKAIHTQVARDRWYAAHKLRSGLCKVCKGYGVNFQAGQCAACLGEGRKV
jgi:DnaJ-class molecular chaperone